MGFFNNRFQEQENATRVLYQDADILNPAYSVEMGTIIY